MKCTDIQKILRQKANPKKAKTLQGFFKTGPGQYGQGDVFLGLTVPITRKIAAEFLELALSEIKQLLYSPIHEERLVALVILTAQYKKGGEGTKKEIFDFYVKNAARINNWDLVDTSAHLIVGPYLEDKDRSLLTKLAQSANLWERRIAIISTFHYIRQGDPRETFRIAEILLNDDHDLIHKAVGWMLRETGKRCSVEAEEKFLKKHFKVMPRTMLRYAIERFPQGKREGYL